LGSTLNNGYGYGYILLYLHKKFTQSTYELLDSTNITIDINGEDLDVLENQTHLIIEELFSESTIILNGEYHSFKLNLPETAIIDKIVLASSKFFIEELKTNSLSKEELISWFQTQLCLIFNLSKFSSCKNIDLDFTRDSILGLYKLEMLTIQELRDYAQNLLIFPKSEERKRVGLLHYADVFHRIFNKNDSLAALALSLKVGKIPVNYYYLTAILLVRIFRDNGFLDKALEILDMMESEVKNYDEELFDLSSSEIEFSRLSIRFKQLLSDLANIENLKKLLDDTISFNHKEMQKESDPCPSLIQAIQINSLLKIHDNSFNKYDSFFQDINIENIGFMSI
jgi:tetratricopeptide (TPR) repeat protein